MKKTKWIVVDFFDKSFIGDKGQSVYADRDYAQEFESYEQAIVARRIHIHNSFYFGTQRDLVRVLKVTK